MKLNRTLAYGLACLHHLSERGKEGSWVMVKDIAARQRLPQAYCNKVLQALVHAGLVKSSRGRGYRLSRPLAKITVWEVMEAFTFNGAPKKSGDLSLVLYESLREQVNRWLVGLTLNDVVQSMDGHEVTGGNRGGPAADDE